MHIRFTTVLGVSVVEEESSEEIGTLSGILINPDSGKIEGFFVDTPGFFRSETLFLSCLDIRSWGLRIQVLDRDVLSPPEDRIRLQPLMEDPRTILGQRIRTESGAALGVCGDVQFDTHFFQVEWLFPRRFFRWRMAFPIGEVLEVRSDAIIVKDQRPLEKEMEKASPDPLLKVPEMARVRGH